MSPSDTTPKQLEQFREQIDALDEQLMEILVRRFDIVRKVGALKAESGLAVVQSERAAAVIERAGERAVARGLDPELLRQFYSHMIDIAHEIEHEIVAAKGGKS